MYYITSYILTLLNYRGKNPRNPDYLRQRRLCFGCNGLFVCPSVGQQDYLQNNKQICIHEPFIRGVSQVKKRSIKFWGSCVLRSRYRIRIANRITWQGFQSLTDCLIIYVIGVQLPFCFKISNWWFDFTRRGFFLWTRCIRVQIFQTVFETVVQYEADNVHQNYHYHWWLKRVAHSMAWDR